MPLGNTLLSKSLKSKKLQQVECIMLFEMLDANLFIHEEKRNRPMNGFTDHWLDVEKN